MRGMLGNTIKVAIRAGMVSFISLIILYYVIISTKVISLPSLFITFIPFSCFLSISSDYDYNLFFLFVTTLS